MGLEKQYIKYGQSARDKIFGMSPEARKQGPTPLSMLISQGAKFNNSKYRFQNKIETQIIQNKVHSCIQLRQAVTQNQAYSAMLAPLRCLSVQI